MSRPGEAETWRYDADVSLAYPLGRTPDRQFVMGPGARLRTGTVLYDGSRIGSRLETGHHVVIREQCDLGDDVAVWSNSVVDYGCSIGNRVKIHCNCYVAQFSVLEDDVFLAPGTTLANDLYPGDPNSASLMRGPTIRRGAQLGVNVTVLPYVTIGERTIVGAGSVVTRDLPPDVVAYGSPAAPTRPRPPSTEISTSLRART